MKKGIITLFIVFLVAIVLVSGSIAQEGIESQAARQEDSDLTTSVCGNGVCEEGEELTVCKDPPRNCDEDCMNKGKYGCRSRCEIDCDDDEENDDDENQGIGKTIRNRVKAGVYTNKEGEEIRVSETAQNRIKLKAEEVEAETELEIESEQENNKTKLKVKLSNGKYSEVKIMPNTASERALERLRLKVCLEENNCKLIIKEVGKGEQTRLAYELQAEKQGRFLGLFKMKMKVQSQIDAENGEIIKAKKPWWAFLVAEGKSE